MKEQIDALLKKVGLRSEEIKLETVTIGEGEATLEAEVFEAGQPVFVIDPNDPENKVALPVGEYKLDDGRILVVAEEGIIAEIKEEEVEEAPEETPMAEKEEVQLPKSIIESTVKETKFSEMELIENLKAELEAVKTELAAMKEEKVELKEEVVEAKAIKPNPEAKEEVKLNFVYGQNRPKNYLDKILERTSK